MTGAAAAREVERRLAAAGVPDPRTDAELLVAHVLGLPRSAVAGAEVEEAAAARLRPLVDRRAAREPLQHVLGEWGFRRLTLRVDGRALVPRPETETVVERCLELLRDVAEPRVLDVGVGSGAIALALADEHPGARIVGIDVSTAALALARENAAGTGLADRVVLRHRDVRAGIDGSFHLVVSNPPYVTAGELPTLAPEVLDWEPRGALLDDGTTAAVARAAARVLEPGGHLVLEVGDGRAAEAVGLLEGLGYRDVRVTRDFAGTERVVSAGSPDTVREGRSDVMHRLEAEA